MVGPRDADDAIDNAFEILAHHRRRYVLQCLWEYDTPLALADLADEVAVREYDAPLPEIDAEDVKRIYLSLYHTHVPKLSDGQYVRYSQEQDTVALGERASQLAEFRMAFETGAAVANR